MYRKYAGVGKCFVLTEAGYERTMIFGTEEAKEERKVGCPIKGYEYSVPEKWLKNGWVQEVSEGADEFV